MLIVLSGLPGTGKTSIARELVRARGGVHLRIDSIELALRDAGLPVDGAGYRIAYAVAEDNLRLDRLVIADCVNPWPLTRAEWHAVAGRAGVRFLDVEIQCSDANEHRQRVESRTPDLGHPRLQWQEVLERDYRPWHSERLVIDTARRGVAECVLDILDALDAASRRGRT